MFITDILILIGPILLAVAFFILTEESFRSHVTSKRTKYYWTIWCIISHCQCNQTVHQRMTMTNYLIHHLSPYLLLYCLNSNLSLSYMNPSTYTLSSQQKPRGILTSCVKPSHLFYSVRWMSLLFKICSN